MRYFASCIWLLVPILVMNGALTPKLPKAYQLEFFWQDIPLGIAIGENVFRIATFALAAFLPLQSARRRHTIGWAVYACGLAVYLLAWTMPISFPDSSWSASAWGFLAPAYTPLIWLTDIGLAGDSFTLATSY
jgi:hypothetical protein